MCHREWDETTGPNQQILIPQLMVRRSFYTWSSSEPLRLLSATSYLLRRSDIWNLYFFFSSRPCIMSICCGSGWKDFLDMSRFLKAAIFRLHSRLTARLCLSVYQRSCNPVWQIAANASLRLACAVDAFKKEMLVWRVSAVLTEELPNFVLCNLTFPKPKSLPSCYISSFSLLLFELISLVLSAGLIMMIYYRYWP